MGTHHLKENNYEAPKGYKLIYEGNVRTSDLLWDINLLKWNHPTRMDYLCGSEVKCFYAVARKEV